PCLVLWIGKPNAVAGEETVTYRLIGLNHPERLDDLRQTIEAIPEIALVSADVEKAEVTLRFDSSKLDPKGKPGQVPAPEKVREQLDKLIGQASTRTFSLTESKDVPEAQLAKHEIRVGLLDCKGCRYGVYAAVAKLDGFVRATVTSESGLLTVWVDSAKLDREALMAALKKAKVEFPES
ncbi:MAG: hypothetical protein KDL87_20165, partial [Verrucomicrobiae bacterium]|nr:hypothetical protein [Verrucomicrobiae bacterium]